MPAIGAQVHRESEAERQGRRRLQRLLDEIIKLSHRSSEVQHQCQSLQGQLDQLSAMHPEWMTPNYRQIAGFGACLIFLLGVYILDYFLFTPVAEFLVGQSIRSSWQAIEIAKALTPATIIMLEVYIAVQIYFAREEAADYGGKSAIWAWCAIGGVFALVMPCAAVATSLAAQLGINNDQGATAFRFLTGGLACLALVAHTAVLFGGHPAHEAKAYVFFRLKHGQLQRRLRNGRADIGRKSRGAGRVFTIYRNRLEQHNAAFQPRIDPGPFDLITRSFLNEHFGYEVIQAPRNDDTQNAIDQPPTTPVPGTDQAHATEETNGRNNQARTTQPNNMSAGAAEPADNGEADYLRTILERQVRNDESEVRP
jgi:hypothetical protein